MPLVLTNGIPLIQQEYNRSHLVNLQSDHNTPEHQPVKNKSKALYQKENNVKKKMLGSCFTVSPNNNLIRTRNHNMHYNWS